MTAETLKPFITPSTAVTVKPSSVTNAKRKTKHLIPIVLAIIALALVTGIFTLTIWQSTRVRQLESDLSCLRREVDSLRQRLGINYLEDMAEFQKEYTNLLIHDPSKLDDLEGEDDDVDDDDDEDDSVDKWFENVADDDDDDDENIGSEKSDYDEYLDLIKQEKDATEKLSKANSDETDATATSSSSASNDDNVYEDFTSYNASKKKRERKSRSIDEMRNELQSYDVTQKQNQTKIDQQMKDSIASTVNPVHSTKQRSRSRQGRQRLLVRTGESPVSAKSADYKAATRNIATATPAAHFHLNRKVPHHQAPIQINSYQGDMYIGHPTATNDNQWQQHFAVDNGVLTVHQAGLYYIYAQICYNNTHDQNGFIIFHGQNAFLQCLNTVPTNMPQKVHTCHTSGLLYLQKEDTIHLRDIHRDRHATLRDANNRSYFGIIKV